MIKRRIFRSILLTAVAVLLLCCVLLAGTMYSSYENRISAALRTEAAYLVRAVEDGQTNLDYYAALEPTTRVTLIAQDGTVLYDSVSNHLESHAERPEVQEALSSGVGESVRYSDTLSDVTLYYALRTADGRVLRIASTRSSVLGLFLHAWPQFLIALALIVAVSLFIARRAAAHIVQPINTLNLDAPLENDVYDELSPLLSRLDKQYSQIRQQMNELSRAHADLNAIMQHMREGLVLLDVSDHILSINDSAATIFATDNQQSIGKDLLSLCRDAAVLEIVDGAQHGTSGDMVLPRGQQTFRISASPVLREDKVCGVVLLALDISAQYTAEASRREFTANVTHELKTPLTSISGYAEIIENGIAQPQDIPAFAGKIHAEAQRLVALVNDILALSRLDERQGLGLKEQTPLLPLLEELVTSFQPMADEKQLTVTLTGTENSVEGYPVLLRELFHNLLENAIKYTPQGGKVDIALSREDGHVVCSVRDNGIGIPAEHQAHVFERFYRVDKSHSRQTGGTGLGLAIVKHVAEVHHAQLTLHSEVNKGTDITVRF